MKLKVLKEYVVITIGIILVAIAVEYFFAPNNIAAGGVTGIAIVINHYISFLSTGVLVFIMNIILFIVAFIFLGSNFGGKTIYASFGLSIIMAVIEKFMHPVAITNDLIIATLFGTMTSAVGMALVFNANGSTGGTDIIAKLLNKFIHTDIGKSLLAVDFLVTLAGGATFGVNVGFYALLSVIINGIAIDEFIEGFRTCKAITIVSEKHDGIASFIMDELGRGCTYVKGVGVYSKKEIYIVYTVLGRTEFIKLKNYMKQLDPKAFITVSDVHEVLGEGFTQIIDM